MSTDTTGGAGGGGSTSSPVRTGSGGTSYYRGSGRTAVRTAAEVAQRQAALAFGASQLQYREQQALGAFEAAQPGTPAQVVLFPSDPKLLKVGKDIAEVANLIANTQNAKARTRLMKRELRLEEKQANRLFLKQNTTEVRVADLQGPNAGYWFERGAPPPAWLIQGSH